MNWYNDDDSDEFDALDEDYGSDFDDEAHSDESEVVDCPECGRPIYEFAERCPHCESYVTTSEVSRGRRSWPRFSQAAVVYLLIGALLLPFLLVLLRLLA